MVARVAGAGEPVLLACRQWDPKGWHRGYLAAGLVRGAVLRYCLGGCSALLMFVLHSWQVTGAWLVLLLVSPPFLAHALRPWQCVWQVVP